MRDAFHEAAIAQKNIGVVINNLVARAIKFVRQQLFSECHAYRIGHALPQRSSSRFHAGRITKFRVAGRFAMQLAKLFQIIQRNVISREVQQGIQQHGCMPVGQHEAVAPRPMRIRRIVAQITSPKNFGNIRHAHGRARMAGIRFLHGVHRQRANRIRQG